MMKLTSLALLGALAAAPAQAVTLAVVPFADVLATTPVIVHGTVGSAFTLTGDLPLTCSHVNVVETLRGARTAPEISVCQLGGAVGGGSGLRGETADLKPGENVVLLLSDKTASGTYLVRGATQGLLKVLANGAVVGDGLAANDKHLGRHRQWTLKDVRVAAHGQRSNGERWWAR